MNDIYLAPGLRTPFVKAGGAYAKYRALDLSVPVVQAMAARARPDFLVWGQVITDPEVSNIARELVLDAKLDATIPAFSTVLACATSFIAAVQAAGMLGRGGTHLALVGGVETMSHVPVALKWPVADRLFSELPKNPAAIAMLSQLSATDFQLPVRGWVNRSSGRSQGEHTEDTVQQWRIARADQDALSLRSHQGAISGQDEGFFDDLVLPFGDVARDTFPRRDTTLEKLAKLPPAFDAAHGTLTAGNASPLTDGAAALWVADREGLARLGLEPTVKLVDWEIAAVDFLSGDEGMLMAPARAIPRLLARHRLGFADIASWNVHEAFAAQVLANLHLAADAGYRRNQAGIDAELGAIPWERINPHGGSIALGHPFAATGARILSQAAKELAALPSGARGIVSLCADGGQGGVALLERV